MMKALVGFAGFGGVDIVLREAGFNVTGIEIEDDIAEVNRLNGGDCFTADLLAVDPSAYVGYWLMHFSPPCPSFSVAKQGGGETEMDLALARKICEFVRVCRPAYFTLENVWGYRKSLSWLLIWYTLLEEGYGVGGWNLNAADYGVPQSRRRMIVIARRDGRQPAKPWPTHSKKPDMFTAPWRGWYEAIEDLIPDLPETVFAPWQLDRLPDELRTILVMTGNTNRNGVDNISGRGCLDTDQPANTVTTKEMPKTFVLSSQNASKKPDLTIREGYDPMFTVTASILQKGAPPKAFIIGGQYGQYKTENNGSPRTVENKAAYSPVWTICGSDKLDTRICQSGKVVSTTPRCLARFQDFPDWFVLPENRAFACRGIGNAVPPGLYRAVLKSFFREN
jgi:DNA (cytosine-5)-methyltransferase 1